MLRARSHVYVWHVAIKRTAAQASIGLVIFISFFLIAALLEGNYGEDAISDDSMY